MRRRPGARARDQVEVYAGPAPIAAKIWVRGRPVLLTMWTLKAWRALPGEFRPPKTCWSWDKQLVIAVEEMEWGT